MWLRLSERISLWSNQAAGEEARASAARQGGARSRPTYKRRRVVERGGDARRGGREQGRSR